MLWQTVPPIPGSAYRSKKLTKLLWRLKIKHVRTRPFTPRTNGMAERFIRTLLREPALMLRDSARHSGPWNFCGQSHS